MSADPCAWPTLADLSRAVLDRLDALGTAWTGADYELAYDLAYNDPSALARLAPVPGARLAWSADSSTSAPAAQLALTW